MPMATGSTSTRGPQESRTTGSRPVDPDGTGLADNGVASGTSVVTGTLDYLPFCSTLISLPTELLNWSWHACWAVTVFAPPMQV